MLLKILLEGGIKEKIQYSRRIFQKTLSLIATSYSYHNTSSKVSSAPSINMEK